MRDEITTEHCPHKFHTLNRAHNGNERDWALAIPPASFPPPLFRQSRPRAVSLTAFACILSFSPRIFCPVCVFVCKVHTRRYTCSPVKGARRFGRWTGEPLSAPAPLTECHCRVNERFITVCYCRFFALLVFVDVFRFLGLWS